MIRRTVHFSGIVQGVGFRFTAVHVASRYEVTGYVRNMSDGRVELVAEGEAREVSAFCEAVRERMGEYVRSVESSDSQATGEFSGFGISY